MPADRGGAAATGVTGDGALVAHGAPVNVVTGALTNLKFVGSRLRVTESA